MQHHQIYLSFITLTLFTLAAKTRSCQGNSQPVVNPCQGNSDLREEQGAMKVREAARYIPGRVNGAQCMWRGIYNRRIDYKSLQSVVARRTFMNGASPMRKGRLRIYMSLMWKPTMAAAGVCGAYMYLLDDPEPRVALPSFSILGLDRDSSVLAAVVGANAAMFVGWRLPIVRSILSRYGVLNGANLRLSTMLTSAFSHRDFWHLALNMVAFWSFGSAVITMLPTPTHFLGVYMSSAVLSSWASLAISYARVVRRPGMLPVPSLGASGMFWLCWI